MLPPQSSLAPRAYRALQRALQHLPGPFDCRVHCLVAVQPPQLRLPARLPRQITVRWLDAADEVALQQLRPSAGLAYAERFNRGHRCLGAFLPEPDSGRLVAFVWLLRGPARLPSSFGCAWDLSATMAWLYDLYSSSSVLGAVPHLYLYLRRDRFAQGLNHWFGQNDLANRRSRSLHLSLGFTVCATLWSLRCGNWFHLSHAQGPRRWRVHAPGGAIPLALFVANESIGGSLEEPRAPAGVPCRESKPALQATNGSDQSNKWRATPAPAAADSALRLACRCGDEAPFRNSSVTCPSCGRLLAQWSDGILHAGESMPYWGEVPQPHMQALLQQAEREGWRTAIGHGLSSKLRHYVADPERAAFQELLPLPQDARVLDVGAGWGSLAAPLARTCHVVAMEGVSERTRFIALRQRQERLPRLTVLQGQVHSAGLAPRQFDAILVNGVLEWSALQDLRDPPRAVQLRFLVCLRELLRPGGFIYVSIENRYGWEMLKGATDHSGQRCTSLMPRWLAHQVCLRGRRYRARNNAGYRTYTFSYRGYRQLFAEAGLQIAASWACPDSYNRPTTMVPLLAEPIRFIARHRHGGSLRTWVKSQPVIWRWFGSDFAFLLRMTANPVPVSPRPTEPPVRTHLSIPVETGSETSHVHA